MTSSPVLTPEQLDKFHTDGYLVIPGFFSQEQGTSLLSRAREILADFTLEGHPGTTFQTGEVQNTSDYFLESGDKIRCFLEEGALDSEGEFNAGVTAETSVNKIGHALSPLDPVFRDFTLKNPKIHALARQLDLWRDPRVVQSMVIAKQPRIGGTVDTHDDSTFLFTDPPSAVGFWFALEACTKTNGCLWFLPGSHKRNPIRKRFVRLPEGGTGFAPNGALSDEVMSSPAEIWADEDFVCEPCEPGTLVIIHGAVIHRSNHNHSNKSRMIYTFHIIDGAATYDEKNWLQPTPSMPFSRLLPTDDEKKTL